MTKPNIFKYFKTSPEIIRLAIMYCVRFPLTFRQVEDILHERGIDVCHETSGFGSTALVSSLPQKSETNGQGTIRIDSGTWTKFSSKSMVNVYLWRAVDQEGEVLEYYVSKRRDKRAAKKFRIK